MCSLYSLLFKTTEKHFCLAFHNYNTPDNEKLEA